MTEPIRDTSPAKQLVNIPQDYIDAQGLGIIAGAYDFDSQEVIDYNEYKEAKKQEILDARPYVEKRQDAYNSNPLTTIDSLVVAMFEKMVSDGTTSVKMKAIEKERKKIRQLYTAD